MMHGFLPSTLATMLLADLGAAHEQHASFESSLDLTQVDFVQVVDPETGEVLAARELLRSHVNNQPFTRALGGVRLPDDVGVAAVRARCNVHGLRGWEVVDDGTQEEDPGYLVRG